MEGKQKGTRRCEYVEVNAHLNVQKRMISESLLSNMSVIRKMKPLMQIHEKIHSP